jgi:CHAT domain-containing protein
VLPPGTAIYYPIILPDRLELLLETAQGIERRSVPVDGETLRRSVLELVSAMRSGTAFQGRAEAMYRRLIEPIDGLLTAQGITTLVAVPDGVLRLLPLGALHNAEF